MAVKSRGLALCFSSNSSRARGVGASQLPFTADKWQGRREQEGEGPDPGYALRAGLPLAAVRKAPLMDFCSRFKYRPSGER